MRERQNGVDHALVGAEVGIHEFLQKAVHAQTACDGEDYGKEWHQSHDAQIAERNGLRANLLLGIGLCRDDGDFDVFDETGLGLGQFLQFQIPDLLAEEALQLFGLSL